MRASAAIVTNSTVDAADNASALRSCRCNSRCLSSSNPTPAMPAASFSHASRFPSLPGRMSAAIGSAGTVESDPSAAM